MSNSEESIKWSIPQQRSSCYSTVLASVSDLIADESWSTTATLQPEQFLFHGNGAGSDNARLLIIRSPECLKARNSLWFTDGNSELAPDGLQQLCFILVYLGQNVDLENKTRDGCEELLWATVKARKQLDVTPQTLKKS